MRKRQSFLQGALILMAATVAVKLVGALFKIPLSNALGGEGMGYFNTAYGLFAPIYALSVSGFPVAVSRMVAEQGERGRFRDIRRVLKVSFWLFLLTGLLGLAVMLVGARPFVALVGNAGALPAVLAIAPAVFFGCLMSAYRGYYNGLRNMTPTAVSQITEAVVKLGLGLGLGYAALYFAGREYGERGTVFGRAAGSALEAQSFSLQYAAAAAVLGITVSTAAGLVYLLLRHRIRGDGITKAELAASPAPMPGEKVLKALIAIAVPVCLGSLVTNLTSLIDLASIMNRLGEAIRRDGEMVFAMYEGLLPAGMGTGALPNYLYGAQSLAVNVFNLVPSLAAALGVSALPSVTAAWTRGNRAEIGRSVESVLRITALLSFPAGIGLSVLAKPVLLLLYGSRPQEAMIAAPVLRLMGIAAILVSLSSTIGSMLQAVGRQRLPVYFMLIGAGVKLSLNFFLVAMPQVNIQGAPVGSLCCYSCMVVLGVIGLCRSTGVRLRVGSVFLRPGAAALLCGGGAYAAYGLLDGRCPLAVSVGGSIACGGVIYLVALVLLRGVEKSDLMMLPKGEKIAKLLAKHRLIG